VSGRSHIQGDAEPRRSDAPPAARQADTPERDGETSDVMAAPGYMELVRRGEGTPTCGGAADPGNLLRGPSGGGTP